MSSRAEAGNCALEWGFSLVGKRWPVLLAMVLIPFALEAIVSVVHLQRALTQQEMFLVFIASSAANAWLISVVVMISLETAKSSGFSALGLALSALRFLPKVLFSYLGFIAAALSAMVLFPLLLVVIFLVWAPFFCVGELFAEQTPKKRNDEYDDYDDDDGMFEGESEEPTYFSRKSVLALGFGRSLHLGSRQPAVTLQVVILIWCANVLPAALVDLWAGPYTTLFPQLVKLALSSTLEVLVLGVAAGCFLALLPQDARRELKLPIDFDRATGFQWDGQWKKRAFVVLSVIAVGATLFIFQRFQRSYQIPESTKKELSQTAIERENAVLTVLLEDTTYSFRWFDPQGFRIRFGAATEVKPKSTFMALEAAEDTLQKPNALAIYDTSGVVQPQSGLVPRPEKLKVVMSFELPTSGEKEFSLMYTTYFGHEEEVAKGTLPATGPSPQPSGADKAPGAAL